MAKRSSSGVYHKARNYLTSPHLFFYALMWLMVLLVVGTIAQRYIGLYRAESIFFSSFIAWFGFIPTPGGYSTIAVIALNLFARVIFESDWSWRNSGIIITHVGALLLIIGALITAVTTEEGYMVIGEGNASNVVFDYHQRRVVVKKNDVPLLQIPYEQLRRDQLIAHDTLPFNVAVLSHCYHCATVTPDENNKTFHGVAKKFALQAQAPLKQDEENLSGVTLKVMGAGIEQDGIYIAFEPMPHQPEFDIGEDRYRIEIGKEERLLPFSIALKEFEKTSYPGMTKAKSYSSEVVLNDSELTWRGLITMNEPLRYQGYTFFQSSFIRVGDKESTVLAVVKNSGRLFPYISSIVMAIGLLLHAMLRSRKA